MKYFVEHVSELVERILLSSIVNSLRLNLFISCGTYFGTCGTCCIRKQISNKNFRSNLFKTLKVTKIKSNQTTIHPPLQATTDWKAWIIHKFLLCLADYSIILSSPNNTGKLLKASSLDWILLVFIIKFPIHWFTWLHSLGTHYFLSTLSIFIIVSPL